MLVDDPHAALETVRLRIDAQLKQTGRCNHIEGRPERREVGSNAAPFVVLRAWLVGVAVLGASLPASTQPNLDQIRYRWRNDDGVESGNPPTQVTATADDTTGSASDVAVAGMTMTPGAGDYHVFFSGSVEGDTGGTTQFVSLYLNGVQVPHTERQIFTEGSIPATSFPVASHARLTGVAAGQDIDVRFRTTGGTATIHERSLVVVPINPADSNQVSATADDATGSATDVVASGMTITPGAGDYHVWFSGSVESNATSFQHVSLYLNGVQIPHTERQITTESSIPNTSFPVALHAKLTGVTGGQAIDVRWRTSAGNATMHQRTLVVTQINPANSTQVSATADDTTSSISDVVASGMTISPGAGDYLVWFSGSAEGDSTSVLGVSLYVNGIKLAHTARQITVESSVPATSFPVATHAHVSGVGAGEPIDVRWHTSAGIATMHERTLLVEDVTGMSTATFAAPLDTKLTGLAKGAIRRVRFEIANKGGSSSGPVTYELQVAETATCSSGSYSTVPTDTSGHWQVTNSAFITDGEPTSNISPGLPDEASTFVAGELKDATSTTGSITLAADEYTELEFSVLAVAANATGGGDYCFRLFDATNVQVLDTYSVYAEVQLGGVIVSASGTQTANMAIPSTNQYVGGKFLINDNSGSHTITGITIKENGTVDAQNDLDNVRLFYEFDTTAPYDGASESFGGSEAQFGVTDVFSAANGSASFTDSVPISTTSAMVVYVLFDVLASASNGETVRISIDDPSNDVIVGAGTVGPPTPVAIAGTTTLAAPNGLTQIHYRWRNDDGSETGAGGSVDRFVSANSDDAEERLATGNIDLNSNLEMAENGGQLQEVGYRFQNVTVPNSASITSAYIQFSVDDTDSGPVSLTIYGQDIDDAPTFTTTNSDITNRTARTVSVLWAGMPNWTVIGERGPNQRTTDLSSIVQQIVSRPGWNSGQSMVFIFSGTGVRTAVPHNTNPAEAALLHIDYGGAGAATWGAPEDTKIFGVAKGTTERVRFEISNEDVASSGPVTYQLQVAEGALCSAGSYSAVSTAATGHWQIVGSTFITDGEATSNIVPGLTDEASTFVAGELKDASNTTGTITLNADELTEIEFAVQATANAIDGQDYCFRLYDTNAGTVLDGYSVYAEAQLAGSAIVLADHVAGQETDKFTTVTPLTGELFAFQLTRVGTTDVTDVFVNYSVVGGVVDGDITNGELWLDNNQDGGIDASDTLIQGSVSGSGGQLNFTTDFTPGTAGSHYIVRATVANLVNGDTTTFSLTTGNIVTGATKSGSATAVVHTQAAPGLRDVYYSIGTNAADLKTGSPMISINGGTATLSVAQTGHIGLGDEIDYGGGSLVYIHAVTSQTVFEVRTATGTNPPDTGAVAVNSVGRTFNTLTDAEVSSPGLNYLNTSDLVVANVRLTWVAYNDAAFTQGLTIDGYTSDAAHYITLTVAGGAQVASGVSQRHTGVAGTGVVIDSGGTPNGVVELLDHYTRFEWFEVAGVKGVLPDEHVIDVGAQNVLISHAIVHDFDDPVNTSNDGISIANGPATSDVTVRNSIIYDGQSDCIQGDGPDDTVTVENTTIYGCFIGVDQDGGASTVNVTNTVAMGNGTDFNVSTGSWSNNISQDGTHPGPGSFLAADETAMFVNVTPGDEVNWDLHLIVGALAIDAGVDLSGNFTNDIDDESRPIGAAWDVGADETSASPLIDVFYSVGTSMANLMTGSANITIVNGTATLDVAQTGNIGVGDVINFGGGTDVYIRQVTSQTEFDVRTVTGAMPADAGPAAVNTIGRVFNTWQDAVDNSSTGPYLGTTNLVSGNFRVTWVGYNDTAFSVSARTRVSGYTTDALHYLTLSAAGASQVASGVSQRHLGTEGAGVTLVASSGIDILDVRQAFTRVQWLELDGNNVGGTNGVNTTGASNDSLFEFVLVHNLAIRGIEILGNNSRLRNCILHDVGNDGIRVGGTGVEVQSCTLYMTGAEGVEVQALATATVENVISVNASSGSFHNDGTMTTNNNLASDGSATAPGGTGAELGNVGNLNGIMPTDTPSPGPGFVIFQSIAGRDFHLLDDPDNTAVDAGKNLSSLFNGDIDGGGRVVPWDIGADDIMATTAVDLIGFDSLPLDGAVEVTWETGSELDNLGFHLHRAMSAEGPYERITPSVIPGLGNSPVGARYSYRDEGLANGVTYYYQLEDIETTGVTQMHGPVSATPYAGATLREEPIETEPGPTTRITYGDPSANGLRVVKQGRNFIVLELTTEGFYAVPQEDGSVALEIPGFDAIGQAGTPSIPVEHHWVDARAGRKVELRSVRGRMEAVTGAWDVSSELRELVANPSGTVRARRRRRMNARAEGLFPAEAARIVTVAFQGESKKALVEMAPLRWVAETSELYLARRLVVRLSFRGVEPSERSLEGNRGRRRARKLETGLDVLARLATTERGLYGVRYEEVFGAGGRLPVLSLRLSRPGKDVAFHVEPATGRFQLGSMLYFVGEGADANPYGNELVYELQLASGDHPGTRMESVDARPLGSGTNLYWNRHQQEVNRYYQAALVDATDLWLWDLLMAPVTKSYPFEVTSLASTVEPGRLDVWLQGTSDTPALPDHHVRAYVNGTLLSEVSWNGKAPQQVSAELAPGMLVEGANVLELENVGDTEASYSTVMLDRFALEYPRQVVAEAGVLEGTFSASGTANVASVSAGAHVLEMSEIPRWLVGGSSFAVEANKTYLVVDPTAVRAPEVRRSTASTLANTRNQADYVVIGPRAFVAAAEPLINHRAEQGLVSKGVAIEDVYVEFGHGESTPEAIRNFLEYAYHQWRAPSLRYVVLLGDGSYDYKDYGELGRPNPVPPLMVKTSYLWTASDPTLAAVNGDDLLPDVALGRLPAATVEDVHTMVKKILAWESNDYGLDGPAVLVADNPDIAGDFVADAEAAARRLPAGTEVTRIYLSELGASATKARIIDAFDSGASLMSYTGHGGIHLWADENLFNTGQLSSLAPQERQPLLLTMNCLNGYFHFPYFGSLAEELVKAENKGAIAAFSPSGLSLNTPAQRFHQAMLDELYSGRHVRLGDAVLGAQEAYVETGAFPELLSIYHLFGDPALLIR